MKKLFPLVTVDIALFTVVDWELRVLIVKRQNDPAPDTWALPGGVLQPDLDDSLEGTAMRIMHSKVGVDVRHLEQVTTVSGPERDPRGWSISTLYYALLPGERVPAAAGQSVTAVDWCAPSTVQERLAFDHGALLRHALMLLHGKVRQGALPLRRLSKNLRLQIYDAPLKSPWAARWTKARSSV